MTPARALKSIQVMAGHSHSWYDGVTTRESINDHSDNVDTKKLRENIHAIQIGCKICEGAHLTKECPLKKEDKAQATNDEWIRKFIENTELNLRALDTTTKNLQVKADQLTQMVLTNAGEIVKAKTKMGHLKKQKDNPYKTRETVCMIGIPEKIHKKKAQEDEGDMDDGWDIMIKDVQCFRQILTPIIYTLPNLEHVVQPYMPRGPVYDKIKVVREEELEYDIPLQNGVMQPLTP
ncbi:hypothetical protein Tco_0686174 [Tanacetum coccineum]